MNAFTIILLSLFLQWSDKVQLSDIKEASELEYLSIKQLKNLLSTNRVDYKGCIERQDLLKKVTRLWQEYSQSRKGNKMQYILMQFDSNIYIQLIVMSIVY